MCLPSISMDPLSILRISILSGTSSISSSSFFRSPFLPPPILKVSHLRMKNVSLSTFIRTRDYGERGEHDLLFFPRQRGEWSLLPSPKQQPQMSLQYATLYGTSEPLRFNTRALFSPIFPPDHPQWPLCLSALKHSSLWSRVFLEVFHRDFFIFPLETTWNEKISVCDLPCLPSIPISCSLSPVFSIVSNSPLTLPPLLSCPLEEVRRAHSLLFSPHFLQIANLWHIKCLSSVPDRNEQW